MTQAPPNMGDEDDRRDAAHEHVADAPVTGGGRDLIASRDRAKTSRGHKLGGFRWVIVGLFVFAACSLAAAVVLSSSGRHGVTAAGSAGSAWSSWRPADDGLAGAQEIADYVAPYYRATPANQLAVVTVVNLNNPSAPVQVVVPAGSSGSVLPLPAPSTIVYNLCGEGSTNCSIGVGKPSPARLLLLQREVLELALYTFKYISGIQTVVAILPPGYTKIRCSGAICTKSHRKTITKPLDLAIAFDRAELATWLARPLRDTLPEPVPPTPSQMVSAPEAELVNVLTSHGMFSESTAQAQDGSTVVTLTGPLRPQ
jgi:hypothetical protein